MAINSLQLRYDRLKEFAKIVTDENLRKITDALQTLQPVVLQFESEFQDKYTWELTENGRNKRSFTRNQLGHSEPTIIFYFKKEPMTLNELQDEIQLPKYDLHHSLKVMSGKPATPCAYQFRNFDCFIETPPLIKKQGV